MFPLLGWAAWLNYKTQQPMDLSENNSQNLLFGSLYLNAKFAHAFSYTVHHTIYHGSFTPIQYNFLNSQLNNSAIRQLLLEVFVSNQ